MMYPRLKIARELLKEEGVIFISLDDVEISNAKKVCDEIFGESNYICTFVRKNKAGSGHDSSLIAIEFDYILCYCKELEKVKLHQETVDIESDNKYKYSDEFLSKRGKYYLRDLDYKGSYSEGLDYCITAPDGSELYSGGAFGKPDTWRWSKNKFEWGKDNGFIVFKQTDSGWKVYIKQYQYVDNNDQPYTREIPYRALIDYSNGLGSKECSDLLGSNVFSYPKPTELLKFLLSVASDEDSIILDFFSGSATTAHAVMQLNAEDGGHRKYIMVQLPETCDENSEAFKAGYSNICEIGEERIRRAGAKIQEALGENGLAVSMLANGVKNKKEIKNDEGETVAQLSMTGMFDAPENVEEVNEEMANNLDVGFKVFKLDSTNIKPWDATVKYDETTLYDLQDSVVKEDRSNLDIAYEVMLKYGIFNMPLEEKEVNGKTVYSVGEGYMIISLNDEITTEDVAAIAALNPKAVVFKESGFVNDNAKMNADYTFKRLGIDNVKCI